MAAFVALKCENCGAKLDVYDDMERFSCSYCGCAMVAERRGGTVLLRRAQETLERINDGVERAADELTLARYTQELRDLDDSQRKFESGMHGLVGMTAIVGMLILVVGVIVGLATRHVSSAVIVIVGVAMLAVCGWLVRSASSDRSEVKRRELHARIARTKRRLDGDSPGP